MPSSDSLCADLEASAQLLRRLGQDRIFGWGKIPVFSYHDDSAAALQKLPHEGNVLVAATAVRKKEDQKTDPFHIRFAQMLFYSYFGLLPDRIAVFFKYFWDILSGRFYIPLIPSTGGQISTEYQDVRLLRARIHVSRSKGRDTARRQHGQQHADAEQYCQKTV